MPSRIRFLASLLLLEMACLCGPASAQQRPQYSQYFTNPYLLNPAVAGSSEGMDLRAGMRLQWVGFTDAPRSFYGTMQVRLAASRRRFFSKTASEPRFYHGLGAQILADVTGPTSRTSAYGSYSLNQALSRTVRAALGASVGLQQFSLRGDDLRYSTATGTVPSFSRAFPDAGVGLCVYSRKLFFGASMLQLFRNSFNANDGQLGIYTAYRHAFVTLGGQLPPQGDWTVVPSVQVKFVQPAPPAVDLNLKARYQDSFWAGISYRHQDAVIVAAGLRFAGGFDFSYSYDVVTSALAPYQRGSHELTIGYRIAPERRGPQPDFWR